MSNVRILDGTGNAYAAKVDSKGHILVDAVTISTQAFLSAEGAGYNLNTGDITLTTNGTSAVLYMKYTGTSTFTISAIAIGIGALAGATNPAVITLVRDPINGTIIDDKTAVAMNQNRNFSSGNALSADVYKGAEGKTFIDGNDIAQFYANANSRLFAGIDFILPQGASAGINIKLNQGSGNGVLYAAFIGHEGTA